MKSKLKKVIKKNNICGILIVGLDWIFPIDKMPFDKIGLRKDKIFLGF